MTCIFHLRRDAILLFVVVGLFAAVSAAPVTKTHVVCQVAGSSAPFTCHGNTFRIIKGQDSKMDSSMSSNRPNTDVGDAHLRVASLESDALSSHVQDQLNAAAESIVASLSFTDSAEETGWSTLLVTSNSTFADGTQMEAAGYLEGHVTSHRITQSFIAVNQSNFMNGTVSYKDVEVWMKKQEKWYLDQVALNPTDPFWKAVHIVHQQISGVSQGYTAAVKSLTGREPDFDPMIWNTRADMDDVVSVLDTVHPQSCWEVPPERLREYERKKTHCSVLLTPIISVDGYRDFAVAHNTWDDFRSMLRIWKTYVFPLALPSSAAAAKLRLTHAGQQWVSPSSASSSSSSSSSSSAVKSPFVVMFSSYPGIIQSIDDFYMLPRPEQALVVTETTNSICDGSLYKNIVPESLLTWHRVLVANLLAEGGETWTDLAMRHNSGTYNNQFMVIDSKAFPKNMPATHNNNNNHNDDDVTSSHGRGALPYTLPDAFLWIVEQYPGGFERGSVSNVVNSRGFWPSYNRPYFKTVFDKMGFGLASLFHGDYYTYDKTARALIFARNATTIEKAGASGLTALKHLMRYNDFNNDPLSNKDPTWTISARYDLLPTTLQYWALDGAIDAKITTMRAMQGATMGPASYSSKKQQQQQQSAIVPAVTPVDRLEWLTQQSGMDPVTASRVLQSWPSFPFPSVIPSAQSTATRDDTAAASSSSSSSAWGKATAHIIGGPTAEQQPVFSWTPYPNYLHPGIPDVVNFKWIEVSSTF